MIFKLHHQRGAASVGEYILTFSLVLIIVAGMTSYFQRSLQGRMRDGRVYLADYLRNECSDTNCVGKGAVGEGYEPYYAVSNSVISKDELLHKGLKESKRGTVGEFFSRSNAKNEAESQSQQLPPINAMNDKVVGAH